MGYHSADMPTSNRYDPIFPTARISVLLILLLLAACTSAPISRAPEPEGAGNPEAAFSRGDYAQAARAWQQQALDAAPGRASALRVRAADAWLLGGNPAGAVDALSFHRAIPPD